MPTIAKMTLVSILRMDDLFLNKEDLIDRLQLEKKESRYLEWKITPPIGPGAERNAKYRTVKAAVSFANTDGGFIIFGVDNSGNWKGFNKDTISEIDPAKIVELFNSIISPDIIFSYDILKQNKRYYPIIHIKKSLFMPHVTTKEIMHPINRHKKIIQKHAVYCRSGGKSDLATASHYERIIKSRTNDITNEILRRFKEVPLYVPYRTNIKRNIIHDDEIDAKVLRISSDPTVQKVFITSNLEEAQGRIYYGELSEELFEEINNVMNLNKMLAASSDEFVFGESIYYRLYSEHTYIAYELNNYKLLTKTGFYNHYAPYLYWLIKMPYKSCQDVITDILSNPSGKSMYHVMKLAFILGVDVEIWIMRKYERQWKDYNQKPNYYFTFKEMNKQYKEMEPIYIALRTGEKSTMNIDGKKYPVKELINDAELSKKLLYESCFQVFKGNLDLKQVCRGLDLICYSRELSRKKIALTLD